MRGKKGTQGRKRTITNQVAISQRAFLGRRRSDESYSQRFPLFNQHTFTVYNQRTSDSQKLLLPTNKTAEKLHNTRQLRR